MNAQDLALALARTTLATTAACGLAWLLLTKLRIDSPRVHRLVWSLAILQGWLLFPWTFEIEAPSTTVSRDAVAERVHSPTPPPLFTAEHQISLQTQRSHPRLNSPLLAAVPVAAWLAGAIALAVAGVYRYYRVLRSLPLGSPPDDPAWRTEWRRQVKAARIPSRRRVDLRMTTDLGPLLCWTPWTYLVLTPKALWAALTSPERQSILRHELAHLQRGDLWKSLAIRVLALPQWFNPLARLAVRRFDEAGEWACDDAAACAASGGPLAFANSLLHAAEFASAELPGSLAAQGGVLSRRIHRLVTPRFKEESKMKRLVVPMLLFAVTVVQLIRVERVSAESAEGSSNSIVEDASAIVDGTVVKTAAATEVAAERVKTFDELAKLPYVIEPPDILLIEGVNLTPKSPHRLEKYDTVLIQVEGALPEQPIDNAYNVDADGSINFGPAYGRVRVVGLTIEESKTAIRNSLSKRFSGVGVSASVVASAGVQSITGQHLVGMDGRVNLGAVYGSVYVAGMTLEQTRKAIERKLAEKLKNPEVVVDVLAYNSKVAYVIEQDSRGYDNVVRLPVPYPLSKDCNVGSVLEQSGPRPYKLAAARIKICRPAPNGLSAELVLPIACDPSTGLITPETNHPLLPGDRIFVTAPATHSPEPEPTRFSPSSPYTAPQPPTSPVVVTETVVLPIASPPPTDLLGPGQRQVIYDIRVLEDAHNSMTEFEPLREKGFMLADTSTTLGALRILEKHHLIKYLAEPRVATTLGRAAQLSVGETMSDKAGDRLLRNGTHVEVSAVQADDNLEVSWLVRVSRDGADLEISKKTTLADGQTAIYKLDSPSTRQGNQPPIYAVLTPTLVK